MELSSSTDILRIPSVSARNRDIWGIYKKRAYFNGFGLRIRTVGYLVRFTISRFRTRIYNGRRPLESTGFAFAASNWSLGETK